VLLVTKSKILGMNRAFGNLGAYNRKLAATAQGQETSSQKPAARSQELATSRQQQRTTDNSQPCQGGKKDAQLEMLKLWVYL
jgi:hypothetical protein